MAYNQHSQAGRRGRSPRSAGTTACSRGRWRRSPRTRSWSASRNYGLDWRRDGSRGPPPQLRRRDVHRAGQPARRGRRSRSWTSTPWRSTRPSRTRTTPRAGTRSGCWTRSTAYNDLLLARRAGVKGSVLWVLGAEDPAVWSFYDRRLPDSLPGIHGARHGADALRAGQHGRRRRARGRLGAARRAAHDRRGLDHRPRHRRVVRQAFPMPYVIKHSGYQPKKLVLTFDDGPDAVYTPGDPRRAEGAGRAGHLLPRRADGRDATPRWRGASCARGTRSAATPSRIPTWGR